MIVERHYDEETLIGLMASRSDGIRDPHLAACPTCADSLASYRAIADVLGDGAVWETKELRPAPPAASLAFLRNAASQFADENAAAVGLVNELLAQPDHDWRTVALQDSRYATAAVVRRLVEVSEALIDSNPRHALETAHVAADIGERLSEPTAKARAAAWRQYAYALFYAGELPDALAAADQAERALAGDAVADYDRARIAVVRSVIFTVQNRYDEAIAAARASALVYRSHGDAQRLASTLNAEAFALMVSSRYREALSVLAEVDQKYRQFLTPPDQAGLLGNIAFCYANTGRVADALEKYQLASAAHEAAGNAPEAARIRLAVAILLATEGQHQAAAIRLRRVRDEFRDLGMPTQALTAGLHLAEVLLSEGRYEEVVEICSTCIEHYNRTGMAVDGLTALSFLKEAVAHRKATPGVVRHVRSYFDRLPEEPRLLFAPPPPPPD
jgi:tetratricopeptide (TPR) repeat protein